MNFYSNETEIVKKKFSFRDRVTLVVLELLERGVMAKLETKWWNEKSNCKENKGGKKKVSHIKYEIYLKFFKPLFQILSIIKI